MRKTLLMAALAAASLFSAPAMAATFALSLTGTTANFSNNQFNFSGLHFNSFNLALDGLDSSNAITVAQGDVINTTVTLDQLYTIGASQVRTDILQFFFGSGFSGDGTGVTGTFNFFNAGNLVNTLSYGSSTSGALASFGIYFPPTNVPLTFDSFSNDVTITTLSAPATLDRSLFSYSLVSNAVPEPANWALMIAGFGLSGAVMRRRAKVRVTYA